MSEYIYLSSDAKLPAGSIGDNGVTLFNTTFYLSENSMEAFFFEDNVNPDDKKSFSFSKHFSEDKFQVASIILTLPEKNQKHLNPKAKKALRELLTYISKHFEHTKATYVEILFSLNGYEDDPLKERQTIPYEELSKEDLYYEERRFLTIII